MNFFEIISILLLIANGVLVPITLYYVTSGKQARIAAFSEINGRLEHLDKCFDTLRLQVVGTGITRAECDQKIVDLRKEMLQEIGKQDDARHDQATRTQLLVDSVEQRLTRRIELIPGRGHSVGA